MQTSRSLTRRTFLKAAAFTAFPTIIPASARGADGRPAPSNRIALAAIGVGGMGSGDLSLLIGLPDVQYVAVCDVDANRRAAARRAVEARYSSNQTYRGCAAYADFREILSRPDIDAVNIATPDHWHAVIAIAAARAGKDIYCQKPLALNIQQGRAMSDAVRCHGVVFQTGSQQRSDSRFRFACELVRNGRIGTVHTVEVQLPGSMTSGSYKPTPIPEGFDYDLWLGPAPYAPYAPMRVDPFGWRWNFDYAGGCITDWGAHHIDIAQWGLGTTHTGPVEIEGIGHFSKDDLSDTAITWDCQCTYANGVKMRIWADEPFSLSKDVPNGVRFIGTDGWVFVNRGRIDAHPKSILADRIGPNEIHLYESNHHYANFIQCIKTRREPAAPVEQAHRSISIAHLCNIAMRLGRKMRWNPDTEQIQNDPVASRLLSRSLREPWHL